MNCTVVKSETKTQNPKLVPSAPYSSVIQWSIWTKLFIVYKHYHELMKVSPSIFIIIQLLLCALTFWDSVHPVVKDITHLIITKLFNYFCFQ